eukprot:6847785-Pyramimonas_sp.AAC.1
MRQSGVVVAACGETTRASGGTPDGATKRVRGAPKWGDGGMRAQPLRHQVEVPMGPRNVSGVRQSVV